MPSRQWLSAGAPVHSGVSIDVPEGVVAATGGGRSAMHSPLPASRLAIISGRIHYAALLIVVASCPFEAAYRPAGRFLLGIFTNLEAALFILGAAWLFKLVIDPSARLRLARLPLLLPILALAGTCVVSMLFGEYRSMGLQFLFRLQVGAMVYASAYEALRDKKRLVVALSTFVAMGTISALLGLLEFAPGIDIQPWLKPFKPQPTTVAGILRLSGTFEYANSAAVYFEMALPLLVGLAPLFLSTEYARRRPVLGWRVGRMALSLMAAIIYTLALILTYSRAALAGLLIALTVFGAVMLFRRGAGTVRPARMRVVYSTLAISVLVLVASGLFIFATQPVFRLRLTTENDRDWYGAAVSGAPLADLSAGEVVTVPITITNYGLMTWPASGALPVRISYHWLSPTEDIYLVFDGAHTPLPHDVSPGETLSVNAIVRAPPQPGDYLFQWDFVHENVTWFEGKQGMKTGILAYHVGAPVAGESGQVPEAGMPPPVPLLSNTDFASVGRGQLWKVALEMFLAHPIAGVGPDGFRNLYGEYAGVTEWNKSIYTNNTYLEMFTDLGLLGGLAFLWLAGLALWKATRNVLREPASPVWIVGLGATAALAAFFAHGVVDYFLFATPIYVSFWFLMAVAVNWPSANSS